MKATALCAKCHGPGATFAPVRADVDPAPDWLCGRCREGILDLLAAWVVEHDRLVAKGMPERDVEKHIATLIARGARPPPVGRA